MSFRVRKHPHLSVAFFAILFAVQHQAGIAGDTLKSIERELQAIMASTKESIVTVTASFSREIPAKSEGSFLSLFKSEPATQPVSYVNIGSGVILDEAGHVLTRRSIVEGASAVVVTFSDGREVQATLEGDDAETGFALLKVEATGIHSIDLGDSDHVLPGSLSLMIGNSLGVYPSLVLGAINGIREDGMIQLSAALNPGNNGSPIINLEGEVIGLVVGQVNATTGGYESFVGFRASPTILVYPVNTVKRIAADLISYGRVRKGWLGVVGFHDGSKPKIREIRDNSPAQKSGLLAGDVIVKFAGHEVENIAELARLVEYSTPGETIAVEYLRAGKNMTTNVELGQRMTPQSVRQDVSSGIQSSYVSNGFEEVRVSGTAVSTAEKQQMLERQIGELERELNRLKKLVNSQ